VYPLDTIKTRIQVHSSTHEYSSLLDAFQKILSSGEGIRGLYSGLAAGLGGTVVQNFGYFYAYSAIRGAYISRNGDDIGTGMELLLGAASGASSQIFTLPIAVVTTRLVVLFNSKATNYSDHGEAVVF
jgi:RsiW-degrading membrane proteinase PrsW (M82 family)